MEYKVIYSGRKTVSLSIKEEKLLVRAPYGTSDRRIEQIISAHLDWINKNIDKQRKRNEKYIKDKKVLLVDDVYTTGATANECAKILKENGAREVSVITIAYGKFSKEDF